MVICSSCPHPPSQNIDFDKIKWGSFSKQFQAFKNQEPNSKIDNLDKFADFIISHPNNFKKTTLKRARFYKNVIEKKGGMLGGDLQSLNERIQEHKDYIEANPDDAQGIARRRKLILFLEKQKRMLLGDTHEGSGRNLKGGISINDFFVPLHSLGDLGIDAAVFVCYLIATYLGINLLTVVRRLITAHLFPPPVQAQLIELVNVPRAIANVVANFEELHPDEADHIINVLHLQNEVADIPVATAVEPDIENQLHQQQQQQQYLQQQQQLGQEVDNQYAIQHYQGQGRRRKLKGGSIQIRGENTRQIVNDFVGKIRDLYSSEDEMDRLDDTIVKGLKGMLFYLFDNYSVYLRPRRAGEVVTAPSHSQIERFLDVIFNGNTQGSINRAVDETNRFINHLEIGGQPIDANFIYNDVKEILSDFATTKELMIANRLERRAVGKTTGEIYDTDDANVVENGNNENIVATPVGPNPKVEPVYYMNAEGHGRPTLKRFL
jgi:hypothetical protein